ncbi:MAG TPA: EamA family transporter, partial [archaeon]|nr:EamA family transporter [archaeon]
FMVVTALRLLVGLAFLALVIAATGPLLPTGELPRLLVMGIALGYVPMYLYYRGLRSTRAQVATFAELLYAAGAIAVNWLLLGLGLTGTQLIATAVLLAAVVLLARGQLAQKQ